MKKLFLIVGLLAPTFCFSQEFSIPWYKISGGGGTSSGGPFTLVGTIGQPAAGMSMSGGNFSLTGGFWSIIGAVQTVGSPTLSIQITAPGTALISWVSTGAFTLQENAALGTANWTTVSGVTSAGGTNTISVSTKPGNNFFRLIAP